MDFPPIFLDLRERPCLVVGGGEVAVRAVALLLRGGARVTVVAPALCAALAADLAAGRIAHRATEFRAEDLAGQAVVIAATGDAEQDGVIAAAAGARGIPANMFDRAPSGAAIAPFVGDHLLAFGDGDAIPGGARPGTPGDAIRGEARPAQPGDGIPGEARPAPPGDAAAGSRHGEVYLVGAGPGDPELLTLRALTLMRQADVALYDNLISPEVLALLPARTERIYVGKRRAHHTMRQEAINALLVELALAGKRVLRLKGGDPFVFGRGGEEIDTLSERGIPFEVVPGITAALGAAAYAGIPLTHRDHAQSCVFVTGHLKDGSMDLDWPALARPRQTIVVYMGLPGLPLLCRKMVEHGLPGATGAAVVQQGTTKTQRVVTGTLATLPALVAKANLHAPTLLIVGEVVRLRAKLNWFTPGR